MIQCFTDIEDHYFVPNVIIHAIESFNGSFRFECLNMNWFMSLECARDKIERWRRDHNEFRPHSATLYLTPVEFVLKTGSEAV